MSLAEILDYVRRCLAQLETEGDDPVAIGMRLAYRQVAWLLGPHVEAGR